MGKHFETISRLGGYLYIIILCIWLLIVYPFGIVLLLPYGWPLVRAWILTSPLLAIVFIMVKNRSKQKVRDEMLPMKGWEKVEATYIDEAVKVHEREMEHLRGTMTALDEYLVKSKRKKNERS